jgi:hypothetical protein
MARAEVQIERAVEQVWERIGKFGDVSWIPNTTKALLDGDVRTFRLGNSVVKHRLVSVDGFGHSYTYALADGESDGGRPAPSNEATIAVQATSRGVSVVTWTAQAEERRGSVEGLSAFFQSILDQLKAALEGA